MTRVVPFDRKLGWGAWLAALALATPALAQKLGQGGGVEIAWWRVAGALVLCLALAVAGAFALRMRLRQGGPAPTLKGLQAWAALAGALRPGAAPLQRQPRRLRRTVSISLSHQVDVCLLECDGRDYLLAATPQGVVVLKSGDAEVGDARK